VRALRVHGNNGPGDLRLEEIPKPRPRENEALVRVRAAALNHRDLFITQGKYPGIKLPCTLGSDACGVLENGSRIVVNPMLNWGNDSRVWDAGSSILGMPHDGSFADYVCVPRENVFPCPDELSDEEAAAIPLGGLTAYRALFTRARLRSGETVLITGVGGGVQTFALILAKQAGAVVVATSSSDAKLERAQVLGADHVLNYRRDPDWFKSVRKLAGAPDVAIDSAGGQTLGRVLDIMKLGGRVVTYGATLGDADIRPFSVFWRHLDLLGTSMGSPDDFAAMLKLFAGPLRPVVDRVYAFEKAPDAFERMGAADQFGKIVLRISE